MKKIFYSLVTIEAFSLSSFSQQVNRPARFSIKIETDLVKDFGNGCYEVQVRVIYDFAGEFYSYCEAYSNVMVGNCSRDAYIAQHQNVNCDDIEFKGDFIINSKYNSEKCFVEYLKDEITYAKYLDAKDKLISNIKH